MEHANLIIGKGPKRLSLSDRSQNSSKEMDSWNLYRRSKCNSDNDKTYDTPKIPVLCIIHVRLNRRLIQKVGDFFSKLSKTDCLKLWIHVIKIHVMRWSAFSPSPIMAVFLLDRLPWNLESATMCQKVSERITFFSFLLTLSWGAATMWKNLQESPMSIERSADSLTQFLVFVTQFQLSFHVNFILSPILIWWFKFTVYQAFS